MPIILWMKVKFDIVKKISFKKKKLLKTFLL